MSSRAVNIVFAKVAVTPFSQTMDQQNRFKPAKLYFLQYTPKIFDSSLSPIIFLHGLCSLHSTWNGVWKDIADETQRQAFSIELRNHGKSEWNDYFSLEHLVIDLENFLTENGIQKCVLVGHSLGGRIALYLALNKPELIEKFVAEESSLKNANEEEQVLVRKMYSFLRKVQLLPKSMSTFEARKLFKNLVAANFPGSTLSSLAYYLPLRRNPGGGFDFEFNFDAVDKAMDDFANFNLNPDHCRPFTGSTLFIYAEGSATKVEEDELVPNKFPNAKLCKFDSKGHVLHMDCCSEYIKKVSEFIRS